MATAAGSKGGLYHPLIQIPKPRKEEYRSREKQYTLRVSQSTPKEQSSLEDAVKHDNGMEYKIPTSL